MKRIKWVIVLMIFILLTIVIGSFIMDREEKKQSKYGTPIASSSFSYKVNEVCSNLDSCEETFEIDDFNNKTIMINLKKNKEKNVDQIKIDKFVFNSDEDTEIDSFGTFKGKYFVIVLKWSTSLTNADREVLYYDKDFNVVSDIKLVNEEFDIPLTNYKYYSCELNEQSTGEENAQKYTINVLEIDNDFNFNVVKDSEMYRACTTKNGY